MVRTAGFPPDMGEATDQRVGRCNNKTVGGSKAAQVAAGKPTTLKRETIQGGRRGQGR